MKITKGNTEIQIVTKSNEVGFTGTPKEWFNGKFN